MSQPISITPALEALVGADPESAMASLTDTLESLKEMAAGGCGPSGAQIQRVSELRAQLRLGMELVAQGLGHCEERLARNQGSTAYQPDGSVMPMSAAGWRVSLEG